jgi:hypothetical protein
LHKKQDGLWDRYKQVGKISPKLMFKPRTVQPVASSHTECAIPATYFLVSTTIPLKSIHIREKSNWHVVSKAVVLEKKKDKEDITF